MKRISLFVCLLLITSCLSGCAPKSPQKIAVVHAVGIDSSDDGFEVSFQIFRASSSGSQTPIDPSQTNVEVISSTAKTIENAVQKCETQIGKTLFFGHNQLLVISEDVRDLYSCFSFFASNNDSSINMVVAATDGKASDIINCDISSGTVAAETMKEIFEISADDGYAVPSEFMKVVSTYIDTDATALLPVVEKRAQAISDKAKESGEPAQDALEINGAALITDGSFGETLEKEDVLGINYFLGNINGSDMVIDLNGEDISVKVKSVNEVTSVKADDNGITIQKEITVRVTPSGDVDNATKGKISAAVEKEIESYITSAAQKTLEQNGADVMNLLRIVRQRDYSLYESYSGDLSSLLEKINVSALVTAVF